MARVLLAWELGDGLGHVARLQTIARRLRDLGHDCVFAVRNVENSHTVLAPDGFAVLQAPLTGPVVVGCDEKAPMSSYGDVIATIGFVQPSRLAALADAWQALVDAVDPALIVADYAPTLALAVHGAGRRIIHVGDGFVLPPADARFFPPFQEGATPRVPPERLEETVREAQRRRGRPAPPTLPSLLAGDGAFVTTLPELDFYGARRAAPAIGPLTPLPAPLDQAPEEDYFAYLSNGFPHTAKFLEGLVESKRRGRVYLRDASPKVLRHWADRGLTILDKPQPMPEAMARAAVAIHHGGIGTVETVMALGRPHLMLPRHQEQKSNSNALGRLKLAVAMRSGGNFQPAHVAGALDHLRTDPGFQQRATAMARDLVRRGPFNALERIVDACRSLLG